jgi:peptidoglycan/LPS O-acetylase OafA/YrhL
VKNQKFFQRPSFRRGILAEEAAAPTCQALMVRNSRVSTARIPELDGLRGLAILSVIAYHYTNGELLNKTQGLPFYVERSMAMGWSGVDLFFILSGFLIGGILVDARNSDSYFKVFYIRRFFRIFPIYYLWILLYFFIAVFAGELIRVHSFSGAILPMGFRVYAHFLYIQNFVPMVAVSGFVGSWFLHTWSLAVEEQFYLVGPSVVRLLSPRNLILFLVGVVVTGPLLRAMFLWHTHFDVTRITPCRSDTLAMGMLLAIAWRSARTQEWLSTKLPHLYILLVIFACGFLALWKYHSEQFLMFTIGFTWIGSFYALVVLLSLVHSRGLIARAGRIRWLGRVGQVSYAMYIIHLVVNLACSFLLLHSRPRIVTVGGALSALTAVGVTYLLAEASWKWLEHPLIRHGHAYAYRAGMMAQVRSSSRIGNQNLSS